MLNIKAGSLGALAALMLVGFLFAAGPGDEREGITVVADLTNGLAEFELAIDGEEIKIDGSDMEIGDSKTLTLQDGRALVLSREESGFIVDVEDEEPIHFVNKEGVFARAGNVVVDIAHDDTSAKTFIIKTNKDGDETETSSFVFSTSDDEHIIHEDVSSAIQIGGFSFNLGGDSDKRVMISGLDALTEERQEQIRQALEEAGVNEDVFFLSDMIKESIGEGFIWESDEDGEEGVSVILGNGSKKKIVISSGDKKVVQKIKIKKTKDDQEN